MDKETIEILDEFNKAIKMGEDSYGMVIEKANNDEFKKLLKDQSSRYEDFLNFVHKQYEKIDKKPADTPITQKVMGWAGIQMNTLKDSSDSHISEMLIEGAIMGYIGCHKLLNDKPDMEDDLKRRIADFSNLQLTIIEELTSFLRR